MGCLYEKALSEGTLEQWKQQMRKDCHNYLTLALCYRLAGLYEDAINILDACDSGSPLLDYYKGSISLAANRPEDAVKYFQGGEAACPDYCFPNRILVMAVL